MTGLSLDMDASLVAPRSIHGDREAVASDSSGSFRLLGDHPNCNPGDPLGFDGLATDLTDLILGSRRTTPFTVGIVGDWGSGKSSLMRGLELNLRNAPEAKSVWFNAWTAERGEALEGLVKTVLGRLDANVIRRAARNRKLVTGLRLFLTMLAGLLRVGGIVDRVWEEARVDPKTRNELRDLFGDAMKQWVDSGPKGVQNRILVVFIDDLDRCSPDTVFQIFEAIKLYLDAPGLVFIVGFDESVISEAVLEQKRYAKSVTGRVYLDKIVQIEVPVPEASDAQMASLINGLADASGTARLLDAPARELIVGSGDRNPRRLKRFINTFVLERGLTSATPELDASVQIKTLVLRTYFRDFALLFRERRNPIGNFLTYLTVRDAFLEGRRVDEPSVRQALVSLGIAADGTVATLTDVEGRLPESFPRLALSEPFVALANSLSTESAAAEVRSRVESDLEVEMEQAASSGASADAPSKPVSEVRPSRHEPAPRSAAGPSVAGVRVLWIASELGDLAPLRDSIRESGGDIEFTPDVGLALALLSGYEFQALVWSADNERGRADHIFAELDRVRNTFPGPVIFFGSWDRGRRDLLLKRGATVVDSPRQLLFELGRVGRSKSPRPMKRRSAAG